MSDALKTLEPLFIEAVKNRKWFLCVYQGLMFSPKELREHNKKGNFCWGAVNWRLVEPPKITIIDDEIKKIQKENSIILKRITEGWDL